MEAEPKEAEPTPEQPVLAPQLESDKAQQSHISKILDEALEFTPAQEGGRAYKHPILLDFALACGLLLAMAGFTIGLVKIYITHSAKQSITQRNYRAAIELLKGAPFPGWFVVSGRDPHELLSEAYYLDATEKLDANGDDPTALSELQKIPPGSDFFKIAQELIREHTSPSAVMLEGQAQHDASPNDPAPPEEVPVIPEEKDATP